LVADTSKHPGITIVAATDSERSDSDLHKTAVIEKIEKRPPRVPLAGVLA
jgi:hypothetical protein